jgi:SlyX protein
MEQDMQPTDATDRRLTELEIKASFAEDLIDKLDQVIVRQQQQIDLLIREVTLLRQPSAEGGITRTTTNARDELPPHY